MYFLIVTQVTFILRAVCSPWFVVSQQSSVNNKFTSHYMYSMHFIAFLSFIIHYKHVKLIVTNKHMRRCNGVSLCLGLVSGFGLLLVASFQVNTNYHYYYTCPDCIGWSHFICFTFSWGNSTVWPRNSLCYHSDCNRLACCCNK